MIINPVLMAKGKDILEGVVKLKNLFKPVLDKIEENFGPMMEKGNVTVEKKEFLNKDALVAIAKANIAEGANGICALLKKGENNYTIWLGNIKNDDFLPIEQNKYVKIETEALSRDVETLFEKSELIILK